MGKIKNTIVKDMKSIGTYKKEFDPAISAYEKILIDYEKAISDFEENGGDLLIEYTNKAGATNLVKNPY